MLKRLLYVEPQGDRLSSGPYTVTVQSRMPACLVISMLRLVWYSVFGSNLCENTNYPDWNFRANGQSFQINAATLPKIRLWPLHFPLLPIIIKSGATKPQLLTLQSCKLQTNERLNLTE